MTFTRLLGWIAAIFICISISFKTTNFKGTILMRIINALGSISFIIYGFRIGLEATPVIVSNIVALIINIVFLVIEVKSKTKEIKNNGNSSLQNTSAS